VASTTLTAAQRSLRARIGALALHAQGGTNTAAATRARLARFEREVDPDGSLPPEERARRASLARKAYMMRLALASSRARSKKKAGAEIPHPAPAVDIDDGAVDFPPAA
jgi:hypothetical protein